MNTIALAELRYVTTKLPLIHRTFLTKTGKTPNYPQLTQDTFRIHSGYVQDTFRVYLEVNPFRITSGYFQDILRIRFG